MNKFFNILKTFITPPVFEGDEDKTRVAGLLNTILYSLIVLLVAINVILAIAGLATKQALPNPFVSIIATTIFISLIILMRLGFVRQVSLLLSFVISGVITLSLARSESLMAVTSTGYIIAIITAGLLSGGWSVLILALFNLLCLGGLNYAASQGITPSQPLAEIDLITFGAFFAISAFLLALASRSIRESMENIRQNEKAQLEANQKLRSLQTDLEQRVADRTKALSSVAEISTVASTILDTNILLQQVVDLSKERFDFYHAHIYLLDEASNNLVLASGAGEPGRKMVAKGLKIPLGREQSLVSRAARERKGVTANDVTLEPDFLPNPLLPDTRSELAVPMIVGDKVLGVFDVQSDVTGRFTDADINIQTTLASQVATAVQNATLYKQAETSAQEAQSLVDNAPEAICIVDLETGFFTNPNENAVKLYGLAREELVKVGPAQMSPPTQPDGRDSTEKAMEKIGEAMKGGTPVFEWVHRNGQGEDFPCEIRLVQLPGIHPRVRASVTDITERKYNEDLLKQRSQNQEALNLITQRIQNTISVEKALQVAARELGRALGQKPTLVRLDTAVLTDDDK